MMIRMSLLLIFILLTWIHTKFIKQHSVVHYLRLPSLDQWVTTPSLWAFFPHEWKRHVDNQPTSRCQISNADNIIFPFAKIKKKTKQANLNRKYTTNVAKLQHVIKFRFGIQVCHIALSAMTSMSADQRAH